MPDFDETFVCTAIPAGIVNGKLRLAVLVSPRLTSDVQADANLENWPDANHWPSISPTWKVTLTQGATSVELDGVEIGAGSYDVEAWDDLFPDSMPTTPYEPVDRGDAPIVSYPVATVRDAVKDLHVETLTNARTSFPTVAALQANPIFQALKEAVIPNLHLLTPDPRPDADLTIGEAFGVADISFGVQPGSKGPPPVIDSVSPGSGPSYGGTPVTILGSEFQEATRVYFAPEFATDVVVVSANEITCVTPDVGFEGTTSVQVFSPNGASEEGPQATFTFVKPPKPTITSLVPNTTNSGSATGVHVHGTGFEGPLDVRFFGISASAIQVLSTTEIICNAPTFPTQHQFTIDVKVHTQGGPSDDTPADNFTYFLGNVPGPK